MLSVAEAVRGLRQHAECLVASDEVGLFESLGRPLASDLTSGIDVPPADNSAMDGYVLRHADWPGTGASLPLSQRITAGAVPVVLAPRTAARIFTGAIVPPGADTVVMQEHCEGSLASVCIRELPAVGANIRRAGQDITAGQTVLSTGHRLRPQDLGLAASLGLARVQVYRRLKVAVLSTGNELVEPGQQAGPGQIYNSNRFTMQGQLAAWGFEVLDLGVAKDDPGTLRDLLTRAAAEADVIISSGGVSVGEEDHVKSVVESLGALDLWRVAIKPGKPFAFGRVLDKPFIGLPGNPVSVFVTLLVIARPFLFACQGITDSELHPVRQPAAFDKPGGPREDYLRARVTENGVELFSNQSSGALYSACWGGGLVRQQLGLDIRCGEPVEFLPWSVFA